ncbi:recombinase family protein [Pontibacter pamirensis]|uniref:recombinase family protein n=1 Tax=Pontibacter pamirensis TaxID=2562824 RepID=UPI0013898123|nr:recombinase family protein [Pontibacter pamirensis]
MVASFLLKALASDTNKQILDTILDKVHRGMSPQQIASHLNSINLKTIRGKKFRTGTINMYLKRARELQLV